MDNKKIITFKNVIKNYGEQKVLDNISFDIFQNDIVGILGPSGVGKTTILRLISKLEKSTSGKIDTNFNQIAYVFQDACLLPWKTTLENVILPLIAKGLNKNKSIKKAKHYLKQMQLQDFQNHYPSQLSGGMKQRVSLARAFAVEPDLLLLDEPFSALDIELKDKLIQDLQNQIKQQGMTVLYISHSPNELEKIVDTFLIINEKDNLKKLSKKEFKDIYLK